MDVKELFNYNEVFIPFNVVSNIHYYIIYIA